MGDQRYVFCENGEGAIMDAGPSHPGICANCGQRHEEHLPDPRLELLAEAGLRPLYRATFHLLVALSRGQHEWSPEDRSYAESACEEAKAAMRIAAD